MAVLRYVQLFPCSISSLPQIMPLWLHFAADGDALSRGSHHQYRPVSLSESLPFVLSPILALWVVGSLAQSLSSLFPPVSILSSPSFFLYDSRCYDGGALMSVDYSKCLGLVL